MLVRFILFNRLFPTLQKIVAFRERLACFASKMHPPAHRQATLWVNVVPMPFCRFRRVWSVVIVRRCRSILHSALHIPHFHVGEMWGFLPKHRRTTRLNALEPLSRAVHL
jgi:hypothetical protein